MKLGRWSAAALFASAFALAGIVFIVTMNFVTGEKEIQHRVERRYALDDPAFERELGSLLGPPFIGGNDFRILLNGDQIFPPMLAAIRNATKTITFETYIYWSGDIGHQFADALTDAARRGVKTHVLLDWVGSAKIDQAMLDQMTAAGAEIRKFHPPHWTHLGQLNNRTHRKLLIVDGATGFTGGVGIAPAWTGHAQDPDHWRDTHVQVSGPVVAQLQAVFLDNWIKVTGAVLHGDGYFPALTPTGSTKGQMFSSSPNGGAETMQLMYLLAIVAATRTIDLSAAYFVPDDLTTRTLLGALRRGVKVRIIVPGKHIDSEAVRSASRAGWGDLLLAGAVIAEYEPTMYHCKVMVIDGLLASLGSTNFDNRSFRLNDEATLNILDAKVAAELTANFDQDMGKARVISFIEWSNRPWSQRFAEFFATTISSQL